MQGEELTEYEAGEHTITFTVPKGEKWFLVSPDGLSYLIRGE